VARIQKLAYGPKFYGLASELSSKTRYDKYAEAFDCYGELVTDPDEIKPAEGLRLGSPSGAGRAHRPRSGNDSGLRVGGFLQPRNIREKT